MGVNRDKPDHWKVDPLQSVDFYNNWFKKFAPDAFRAARVKTTERVEEALVLNSNLRNVRSEILQKHPHMLPVLRMSTCPPWARDRLIGLAGVSSNIVMAMEKNGRVPLKTTAEDLKENLEKTGGKQINIPVDVPIMRLTGKSSDFPL